MRQINKAITLVLITFLLLTFLKINLGSCQTITLKMMEATTNNNSITLGNETDPIPREGIPFTVKIILEGSVTNLMSFQVGTTFNYEAINCTGAWIPSQDTDFIFYGKTFLQASDIQKGEVVIGAAIIDPSQAVTTNGGLLCMLNFTANKKGTYTIDFYDSDNTFFLNNMGFDIVKYEQIQKSTLTINVLSAKAPPVASFTWNPKNPKANETITFDASLSYDPDGQIVSYIWDFGDESTNETEKSEITHVYTEKGVYTVNLTVVDNDNLTDSLVQIVMTGHPPIVIVELPNPPFKPGDEIIFNASLSYDPDGQIVSYIWDFGDGTNQTTTESTLNHTYEKRGLYKFALKLVDNDGLSNSTSLEVPIGNPPKANFTFNPTNPKTWETVTFDASGSQLGDVGAVIKSFVWYFEDMNIIETPEPPDSPLIDHVFSSEDLAGYNVTLTVYDVDGLYNSCSALIPVSAAAEQQQSGIGTETIILIAIVIAIIAIAIIVKLKSPKEEAIEI